MEIKVYVTNLAKYNDGHLFGEWVNLSEVDADDLNKIVKRILGTDEEFFITDYEAPFKIEEYSNLVELWQAAQAMNGKSDYEVAAMVYLINEGYEIKEAIEKYEDICIESADSFEALAEQHVEEGLFGDIPESLQNYIDYEKIGRDLSYDYSEVEYNGSLYFVDNNSY